jgi:hypothetical protein
VRDHPRLRHLAFHEQVLLAEFLSWLQEQWSDRIARARSPYTETYRVRG